MGRFIAFPAANGDKCCVNFDQVAIVRKNRHDGSLHVQLVTGESIMVDTASRDDFLDLLAGQVIEGGFGADLRNA